MLLQVKKHDWYGIADRPLSPSFSAGRHQRTFGMPHRSSSALVGFLAVPDVCGSRPGRLESMGKSCMTGCGLWIVPQICFLFFSAQWSQSCLWPDSQGSIRPTRKNRRDTRSRLLPQCSGSCICLAVRRIPGLVPEGFRYSFQTAGYRAAFPALHPDPTD